MLRIPQGYSRYHTLMHVFDKYLVFDLYQVLHPIYIPLMFPIFLAGCLHIKLLDDYAVYILDSDQKMELKTTGRFPVL